MKRCSYCGKENDDDSATCRECGTRLEVSSEPPQIPSIRSGSGTVTACLHAIFLAVLFGLVSAACGVVNPALPVCFSLLAGAWGGIDALALRRKNLSRGWPDGDKMVALHCFKPIVACWLCAVPWPLGFAWYLVMRKTCLIPVLPDSVAPSGSRAVVTT